MRRRSPPLRSATINTAKTPRPTCSRRRSRPCSERKPRSGCRPERWPIRSRCACSPGRATTSSSVARVTRYGTKPAPGPPTPVFSSPRSALEARSRVDEFLAACKPAGHVIYPPTTLVEIENTAEPRGRRDFSAGRSRAHLRRRSTARASLPSSTARGSGTCGGGQRPLRWPSWRRRSTWHRSRCPKGWARPAARSRRIARADRTRRALPAHARRSDASGGNLRRRGLCTRWSTTSSGWPRITPTRDVSRSGSPSSKRIDIDLARVQTNILVFSLAADAPDAPTVVTRARERGVLVFAFTPRMLRAVTHLDVSAEQCARAADILVEIAEGSPV